MNKKRKYYVHETLEGVLYWDESVGAWYLVDEEELPELAKETPEITGQNLLDDLNPEEIEGRRIRIIIEVESR